MRKMETFLKSHLASALLNGDGFFRHGGMELLNVGRFIVCGALISAILQIALPASAFQGAGKNIVPPLLIMLIVSFVMSVCSTSVDAYYYFGDTDKILPPLVPLVKKCGYIAVAIPGLKYEFGNNVPNEMQPFWNDEVARTIRSIDWWKNLWQKAEGIDIMDIREMTCCKQAWSEWLTAYHPVVAGDIIMMEASGSIKLVDHTAKKANSSVGIYAAAARRNTFLTGMRVAISKAITPIHTIIALVISCQLPFGSFLTPFDRYKTLFMRVAIV
nr:hypothetical protein [Caproiciproducens faecalis]